MSEDVRELMERLRKCWANAPEVQEAAAALERLLDENESLREELGVKERERDEQRGSRCSSGCGWCGACS